MPSPRPFSPPPVADDSRWATSSRCSPTTGEITVPLTPTQGLLVGADTRVVARHWEQAVWGEFSLPQLRQAATAVACHHPLVRATLGSDHRQHINTIAAEPLVRVTDAAALDESERRRILTIEREHLCLGPGGGPAHAWQLHVLLTGGGTAVITAGFARVFFDRTSVRQVLKDLVDAYHGIRIRDALDTPTTEGFVRDVETSPSPSHPAAQPPFPSLPPGPELPLTNAGAAASPATFSRVSVRIEAATWMQVKSNLAAFTRAASIEALVFTACGSVLARWSRNPRFSVQLVRDVRGAHRVPLHTPGQFSRLVLAPIDDTSTHSFADRVNALHQHLETMDADEAGVSGELPVVPQPAIVLSWWSAGASSPGAPIIRREQFVFVGASRPGVALEFHAEEDAEGALQVHLDAPRDLFPAGVIDDLSKSLENWLRALGTDDKPWQLAPAEQAWRIFPPGQLHRQQAVNTTQAPVSDDRLFSGFLRQLPEARTRPAVITPERTLTYEELYGHACGLAYALRARGVRRNELVAIAAEKGWEQIAAAVGVTLAGAAYLPVDLELPEERIRFLLAHGEVRVVVTQARHADSLPRTNRIDVIALDHLPPASADTPPPGGEVGPEDLAYVIFTSGSTGTPKGVMIDHRGAVNTIVDLNERFHVQPTDRVLALSRLSFDLSVYDIFGLLAAGGAIVVPAAELARDPAHWAELMRDHAVTIWNTVPALMQLFVDSTADRVLQRETSLRLVWMSGDWIPLSLPDRIQTLWPGVRTISMGGATEASIWSILFPITAVDPAWRSIPYGRPMVNQTFHVLHENLTPAPDHVTGELFIGGIGVARGYWKDPDKTKARFLIHPRTGERLYRTGDLGRFLPDGNIEFLGRADFQVKIRGYRIELGEIEAALTAHKRVRAAVVVAQGDNDNTRHLVAYIVAAEGAAVVPGEFQDFLRRRLPEYMVPHVIVGLERLPLTANGKVDLKALPAPGAMAPCNGLRPAHADPTNDIEEILLQVWRQVLNTPGIGIHDNFFALGGNSLSGTRTIIRLRAAFSLPLPVQLLFDHPTISRLAGAIERVLLADVAPKEPAA